MILDQDYLTHQQIATSHLQMIFEKKANKIGPHKHGVFYEIPAYQKLGLSSGTYSNSKTDILYYVKTETPRPKVLNIAMYSNTEYPVDFLRYIHHRLIKESHTAIGHFMMSQHTNMYDEHQVHIDKTDLCCHLQCRGNWTMNT